MNIFIIINTNKIYYQSINIRLLKVVDRMQPQTIKNILNRICYEIYVLINVFEKRPDWIS